MQNPVNDYKTSVIDTGDRFSDTIQASCAEANMQTTLGKTGRLRGGKVRIGGVKIQSHELVIQTDGVGTKIRIYMAEFERLFDHYVNEEITEDELLLQGWNVLKPMWYDLCAMVLEDLRDGERPIALADVIVANHLNGKKGEVFRAIMARAVGEIIAETDVPIIAGETAIHGAPESTRKLVKNRQKFQKQLIGTLRTQNVEAEIIDRVQNLCREYTSHESRILEEVEIDISGFVIGEQDESVNFGKPKAGDEILIFQEQPKNGIIGPRSNGITDIREIMERCVGEDWGGMTFEALLDSIYDHGQRTQLEELDPILLDKKLWEIATGQSTLFLNSIRKEVFGKHEVIKLIHVTGNPLKKLQDGIPAGFSAMLDVTDAPIPPIFRICQILDNKSDEWASMRWNMGIPYAVIVRAGQGDAIIDEAKQMGRTVFKAGTITPTAEGNQDRIEICGLGSNNITVSKQSKKAT